MSLSSSDNAAQVFETLLLKTVMMFAVGPYLPKVDDLR